MKNYNKKLLTTLSDIRDEEEYADGLEEGKNTNHSSSVCEELENIEIGQKENKQVSYLRAIVSLVLIGVATAVSVLIYLYSKQVEKDEFVRSFTDSAEKIITDFTGNAEKRIMTVTGFTEQMTSFAIATNAKWPNVMFPDFERQAKFTLESTDLMSLILFPMVTNETRTSWETFSVKNQGWLKDALETQGIPEQEWDKESIDVLQKTWGVTPGLSVPKKIFRISGISTEEENGPGPYAPWWQFAPAFPVPSLCNYNGMSHPTRHQPLASVLANKKALLTEAWDYSDVSNPGTAGKMAALNLFLQHGGGIGSYQAGPVSDLYLPIFEDFSDEKKVVAELTAYVYWQVYFENILPDRDIGLRAILDNSCGQQFTYQIDGGHAHYVGPGELYDITYEHLGVSTQFGAYVNYQGDIDDLPEGQCLYRLRVYPSRTYEDQHRTSGPLQFTLILVATFLFTCFVFFLYDYLVERRQKLVMKKAVQSSAVVASLFPQEVRDRLYENNEKNLTDKKDNKSKQGELTTKNNAESYLASSKKDVDDEPNLSIADLYPNCTVMFADIVGFTRWSSKRQPTEVFYLLETLYKTFDKTAMRLGVFKVETIGDCYVAVTGLPRPQEDHAIIMARFAAECLSRVPKIVHRVAHRLDGEDGETDTVDLTLRVGLHSGPVTAGVLRGLKARFQLFGDTVNTAARMESTGQPRKIQVSSTTAELLVAKGKSEWVKPREEAVEAKGKGVMHTYWLQGNVADDNSPSRTSSYGTDVSSES